MRVLLDANIFISYLLSTSPASPITQIVRAGVLAEYQILLPQSLLEEFTRKIPQKKYLAERITPAETVELVSILSEVAEMIPPIAEAIPAVTRDPKDDYLLAYAVIGQADYLVTGDDDLLDLEQVGKVQIVTPREFLDILEETPSSGG